MPSPAPVAAAFSIIRYLPITPITTVDEPETEVDHLKKAIEEEDKRIELLKKDFEKQKEYPADTENGGRSKLFEVSLRPDERQLFSRAIVSGQ